MDYPTYLNSLIVNQKFGSERTHYPALKQLLDHPNQEIEAAIEETGNKAGIPDFTVRKRGLLLGYVEAKELGSHLDKAEKTPQLTRYREAFSNLILTNYLEFRWYVNGKRRTKVCLGTFTNKIITPVSDTNPLTQLLEGFLHYTGEVIHTPEDLAQQMARLTKAIKYAMEEGLKVTSKTGELQQLKRGFQEVLLPDLADKDFADMYAQTLSYGLFAARVSHAQNPQGYPFDRATASLYIPATNPFLKRLFNIVMETDALSQINWAIDDLVQLLSQVNMTSILEDFGRQTRQEDPVVHFYETFLAAYDKALRKSRGVYYTPEPVVSFIVRSVDLILKEKFNLPLGLADNTADPITQKPRVQILDPATGTGTFIYSVINQIYQNLESMGLGSCWNEYVSEQLLTRLFGFELLMAPYSIAHLKLGLQLESLGYQFTKQQRLGIYLTNTLDEALKKSDILFGQFVANEANDAASIKQDLPIMVVLGNPPYSVSSQNASKRKRVVNQEEKYLADIKYTGQDWNKIYKVGKPGKTITELTHIGELLERYKGRVRLEGERNIQPLDDDYIKFIRFAHHRIETTGYGVLGFVTNHSYINGLIHRGMREELLKNFDEIYVMDLHGNSLLQKTSPDGSLDQNVFDIQQGVAIFIAVKYDNNRVSDNQINNQQNSDCKVFSFDLWGSRQSKYEFLNKTHIHSVDWTKLNISKPNYFFTGQDFDTFDRMSEYQKYWSIKDIFSVYSNVVETGKDEHLIAFKISQIKNIIEIFSDSKTTNDYISKVYKIPDSSGWNFYTQRSLIVKDGLQENLITPIFYRPFDIRFTYYHSILRRMQEKVLKNMLNENLGLLAMRQVAIGDKQYTHFGISNTIVDNRSFYSNRGRPCIFPLYIYPDTENNQGNLFTERTPNLSSDFLATIKQKLGYYPTPEAIFYYAYAIFHSPTYRQRYAEFLKIDFPRLPLTSNDQLFQELSKQGEELVNLHLMKSNRLHTLITQYQGEGDNQVTQVKYNSNQQRIYINPTRYFQGINPQVWKFKIGGYQVLDKWLKDRKKAKITLSFNDIVHYQKMIVALNQTIQIMTKIDTIIPRFPIE